MKQKLLFIVAILVYCLEATYAQTGYIYVHLKHINEEASPNYLFTLTNASGTVVNTFSLNDQATADNVALSGNYVYVYDIGESHGTGGDGQLWTVGGTSWGNLQASHTLTALSGSIRYRNAGSSVWNLVSGVTTARNIDGAYANQCVYTTTSGTAYFYNATTNTSTLIYNGTDAWDVSANNGVVAISTTGGKILVWKSTYTAGASPAGSSATTNWNSLYTGGSYSQLDMNLTGTKIVAVNYNANTPYTLNVSTTATSTATSLGAVGTATAPMDIAYDDSSYVYCSSLNSTSGLTGIYSSSLLNGTSTVWTYESRSGDVTGVTAGAGRSVFGVQTQLTSPADETIFGRFYDSPTGTTYWVDDDRVKSSASIYDNGIIIAVPTSGSPYTLTETLQSGYDLGRYNIYDPQGATTGNVSAGTINFVVAQNEVVFGEFVNEKLNAKAIALTCTFQYLQTFDATNSSPLESTTTFGTGTYGTNVEGTSYHYWNQADAHDGYYFLIKNETGSQWFTSDGITDHTANGGYFLLVNASFQADEFYRQRVTNLEPGLSYTISFWAANASQTATTLEPNITFGLQDTMGNLVNSSTSGNITTATWTQYSFTFTATTATADLYLSNNGIGGNGNDIAIDDIAINPVTTPLPNITVSPVILPNVCIGTVYTFKNNQSGGVWTSSPSTVDTVLNSSTGKIKGIAAGDAVVTYTYTNSIGCQSTTSTGIIVSAPPTLTTSDLFGGSLCLTQTDSLYSTPAGGTTPYTYAWTDPSGTGGLGSSITQNTTAKPTVAGAYTYIIVVTDSVGCSVSGSVPLNVSSSTPPVISATASAAPYCTGSTITLNSNIVTGSTGHYTYAWSATPAVAGNGLTGTPTTASTTVTPTTAGSYAYKVKVNDGFCTVPATVNITENTSPQVSVIGPSGTQALCGTGTIALNSNLTSSGTAPVTYAWTGSFVSGLTTSPSPGLPTPANGSSVVANPTLTLATVITPDKYKYVLTVTDSKSCTAKDSITITAYRSLSLNTGFSATASSTPAAPVTLCSGTAIALASSSSGGSGTAPTYAWTGPGSFTSTSQNPSTTATATGNYVVTITDAGGLAPSGCTASASTALITVNPSPSVTVSTYSAAMCSTNSVDSASSVASGGSGAGYNYAWTTASAPSGGSVTLQNASAASTGLINFNGDGNYTFNVVVTDASNSCTATATTSAITYNISSGPSISSMPSAAAVCYSTAISLSPTVTDGTTYTALTGTAIGATPTGATSLANAFDANVSTYYQSNSTSGWVGLNLGSSKKVYYVSFYPVTGQTSVLNGAQIQISNSSSFSSGVTTLATISSTPTAGQYTTLAVNSSTSGQYIRIYSSGKTMYVAELKFYTTGSNSISTYAWTATPTGNGLGTATTASTSATPTAAGSYTYTIKVTDNNNCSVSASTGVQTVSSPITVIVSSDAPGFCGATGSLNLAALASGGSGSYVNYAWTSTVVTSPGTTTVSPSSSTSSNVTTATIAGATVGTSTFKYTATVTDGNGCTGTGNSSVLVVGNTITLGTLNASIPTSCIGQIFTLASTSFSGGTGPYSYQWTADSGVTVNNSSGTLVSSAGSIPSTTATATVTGANNFGLLLIDKNNCKATGTTASFNIVQISPSISLTCGSTGGVNWAEFYESNGASWLWTTTSGGRFYTTSALSANSDGTTSTLQAPYVTFMGPYSVSIVDANGCTGSGSYTITSTTCSSVLAVSNLNFTAVKQDNEAQLAWSTSTEANNNYFNIERSSDGVTWQAVGTVKAVGNSTTLTKYSFTDAFPLNGINYYRLKQVDDDGQYSYSPVRSLEFTGQWLVKLYPNPVQNFIVLEFNNDRDERGVIAIKSVSGSAVFTTEQQLVKGLNLINLNQVQRMAQGTYILTLQTNENIFRSKFVKGGN